MDVAVIGINHKTADVSVREKAAFNTDEQSDFRKILKTQYPDCGCMILSTCNRSEIYISGAHALHHLPECCRMLDKYKNTTVFSDEDYRYLKTGSEAVSHFFRVVSSLDSQIIGETQITSQVKEAYFHAHDAGDTDIILNKLFNYGIQLEKKVRSDTFLTDGAVSVSFAAVEMAKKIFLSLKNKQVVLIGAGETAELAAVHFKEKQVKEISVVNRTLSRAEELAKKFAGHAFSLLELEKALIQADIVISATASKNVILEQSLVKQLALRRNFRPLFLIDIAIPRDIDPKCSQIEGVFLFNLDDLQSIVQKNLERRRKEIPRAEKIIENYLIEFEKWYATRPVTATITRLNRYFEKVRQLEYDRLKKRFPENVWNEVDYLTRSLMQKYLHHHIVSLRNSATDPEQREQYISMVNDIYGLDTNENSRQND